VSGHRDLGFGNLGAVAVAAAGAALPGARSVRAFASLPASPAPGSSPPPHIGAAPPPSLPSC
jgi:hypothetical protein